jgi:hypothetical protein
MPNEYSFFANPWPMPTPTPSVSARPKGRSDLLIVRIVSFLLFLLHSVQRARPATSASTVDLNTDGRRYVVLCG